LGPGVNLRKGGKDKGIEGSRRGGKGGGKLLVERLLLQGRDESKKGEKRKWEKGKKGTSSP